MEKNNNSYEIRMEFLRSKYLYRASMYEKRERLKTELIEIEKIDLSRVAKSEKQERVRVLESKKQNLKERINSLTQFIEWYEEKGKEQIELGKILYTEELVIDEVLSFENFLKTQPQKEDQRDIDQQWIPFYEWVPSTWWYSDSPSDINAVWHAYHLRREGKESIKEHIEEIVTRTRNRPYPSEPEPESYIEPSDIRLIGEIEAVRIKLKPGVTWEEWEEVCNEWDTVIIPMNEHPETRKTWDRSLAFMREAREIKQKMADLQIGKRLCQSGTCLNYIPSTRRASAKYCSDICREREKNRRKDLMTKYSSQHKFLQRYKDAGDFDKQS